MTLLCECINISKTNSPKQEPTPTTSWPLQPPEGAPNLRNYFTIANKKADAETAVKVAGATAKHCIVIHGVSTFLSGEGHNLEND